MCYIDQGDSGENVNGAFLPVDRRCLDSIEKLNPLNGEGNSRFPYFAVDLSGQ